MTCNFCVISKLLDTHKQILSNGINMTRHVMILLFVIYKKYIPSDPMAQSNRLSFSQILIYPVCIYELLIFLNSNKILFKLKQC